MDINSCTQKNNCSKPKRKTRARKTFKGTNKIINNLYLLLIKNIKIIFIGEYSVY